MDLSYFQRFKRTASGCPASETAFGVHIGKGLEFEGSQRVGVIQDESRLPTQIIQVGLLALRRSFRWRQVQGLHVRPVARREREPVRAGEFCVQSVSSWFPFTRTPSLRSENRQLRHGQLIIST